MTKQALKIALAALGNSWTEPGTLQYEIEQEAITAITEAIAELESQEPVAWRFKTGTWWNREVHWRYVLSLDGTEGLLGLEPLYTHPPQRTEQEPMALPCCGYTDASAVKWNPLNGVVQCHNCGQTYTTSQRTCEGCGKVAKP